MALAACGDDVPGKSKLGEPFVMPACELDEIAASLMEAADPFVPLQSWLEKGTAPKHLFAAAQVAHARTIVPEKDVHDAAQVHAAYVMSQRLQNEHPLLPLFWLFRSPLSDATDTPLLSTDLPASDAAAALEEAVETSDFDSAQGAILAVHAAGPEAVVETLSRICQRDHNWLGHDAIWTAFAFRSFRDLGWQCAPWVLRGLARSYAKPDKSISAYTTNLGRLSEVPDNWREGTEDPTAVPQLLEILRTGTADSCVEAVVSRLQAGIGPATIWTALGIAAVELAVRYQHASWGVHELDAIHALRTLAAITTDADTAKLALLQAVAWRPEFAAFNKNDAQFSEGLDELVAHATTPDLTTALESMAGDRVEAARMLQAYFDGGGTVQSVLDTWPDIIASRAGKDPHHVKYHLALLEEVEAALPQWQSTLLLGITMRGPSPLDDFSHRYDDAQAIIASLPS